MAKTLLELTNEIKADLSIGSVPYSSGNKFINDAQIKVIIRRSVRDAEALIHTLYEDYFRTNMAIPLLVDQASYSLPSDIYASKIRRIMYDDGTKFYRILRMDNINEIPTVETGDYYRYYLTNSLSAGVKIQLTPPSVEDSQLGQACRLANAIKAAYTTHIADTSEHTTAADATNTVSADNAIDETTLLALVVELITDYDAHEGDAELGATWLYHAAQEASDHSLASITSPTTITEAVTILNDMLIKYNAHDADTTAHGVGSSHQVSTAAVDSTANNARVYYIRRARVLTADTDELDIPEFENYILADAKHRVLQKDPGNPIRNDIYIERKEQKELMIMTLSNRVPDDQQDMHADTSFYNDFTGADYDY